MLVNYAGRIGVGQVPESPAASAVDSDCCADEPIWSSQTGTLRRRPTAIGALKMRVLLEFQLLARKARW
jgi:hypothetical protein